MMFTRFNKLTEKNGVPRSTHIKENIKLCFLLFLWKLVKSRKTGNLFYIFNFPLKIVSVCRSPSSKAIITVWRFDCHSKRRFRCAALILSHLPQKRPFLCETRRKFGFVPRGAQCSLRERGSSRWFCSSCVPTAMAGRVAQFFEIYMATFVSILPVPMQQGDK